MTYHKLTYPFILLAVLSSCTKMAGEKDGIRYDSKIVFTERMAGGTKASEVTSLDGFNVICVTGEPGYSEALVFNKPFSRTGAVYTGGQYWSSDDRGYKFYASNAAMSFSAVGPVISADTGTDQVCAVCLSPVFRASNELVFDHVFARIGSVTVNAPDTYTVTALSVTVDTRDVGLYNLYAGKDAGDGRGWSNVTSTGRHTIATAAGENANDVYLIPGEATLEATYTLKKGDYVETFTKHAEVLLTKGKVNSITTTLPQGFAEAITCSVSLVDWSDNQLTPTLILE